MSYESPEKSQCTHQCPRLYDERISVEPDYPATKPSKGDPSLLLDSTLDAEHREWEAAAQKELLHAPPGSEYRMLGLFEYLKLTW